MEQLRNLVAQLGTKRLMIMGGVAAALLLALTFVALRGENKTMGFLYTDLDPGAAASITDKLKAQNVPFELTADGTAILAPEDKLAELRMAMAGDRLGGKIGYEVLDEEQPFGVSSSRAKLNETRAIEGELSRSIQSIDQITAARVHLVMPERAMFAAEARPASASVTVKTRGRLPSETVKAIRYLVSSAVPELSPEAVSIVDQSGALLARAGDSGTGGGGDADERQVQVEHRLREQITALLEPIVGQGKVRAEVAAQIDRDSTREERATYDPDTQVIARQVTVESDDQNNEKQASDTVSVGNELPETQGQPAPPGDTRQSARRETSEDTTYANSLTRSVVDRGPGQIKRLSVAVMVDGGEKGLPEAQIQRLTRLVENAVGMDSERGDSVVIESMAFTSPDAFAPSEDAWWKLLDSDQATGLIKLLIVAAVGLVALRMIKSRTTPEGEEAANPGQLSAEEQAEMLALADQAAQGDPEALAQLEARQGGGEEQQLLDHDVTLANVDGRVRASSIKAIGEMVEKSPPEAAAVLRQWMNA